MSFDFDPETKFESHKGSDAEPKRHKGSRKPPPIAVPEPSGPPPQAVNEPPASAPPAPLAPAPKAPRGRPRTGQYPARPYHPRKPQKGREWAKSDRWMPYFFKVYAGTGSISQSAWDAGVSPALIKHRVKSDEAFAAQLDEAHEVWLDVMEREVRHRAINGEDVFGYDPNVGGLVYKGRRRSDLLLMFLVKRFLPEYRDNYQAPVVDKAQAIAQTIALFLGGDCKPKNGDQATLPSLDQFVAQQSMITGEPVAIEAPSETKEEKRLRLLSELAALEADEAPAADANV